MVVVMVGCLFRSTFLSGYKYF